MEAVCSQSRGGRYYRPVFFPDARVALNQTMFVVARFNVDEEGLLSGCRPVAQSGVRRWRFAGLLRPFFEEPGPRVIGGAGRGRGGQCELPLPFAKWPRPLRHPGPRHLLGRCRPGGLHGTFTSPAGVLAAPKRCCRDAGEEWTARAVLVGRRVKPPFLGGRRSLSCLFPSLLTSLSLSGKPPPPLPPAKTSPLPSHSFQPTPSLLICFALGACWAKRPTETPSTEIITQPAGRTVWDGDRFTLS